MPRKIILPEDQIEKIIKLYKSGLSYVRISDATGIDANKVKRTLREKNVQFRPHKSGDEIRRSFTEEEEKQIVEMYNNKIGITTICKVIKCSPEPVRTLLRKNGIKLRNAAEAHETQKMRINENYFDVIDNQDKAYILGFLFTDGTNAIISCGRPTYAIHITLQEKDAYILERIREKMGLERKVKYMTRKTDGRKYARLEIKNKHMSLRLNELGIVQNKTFVTKFPDYLSDELVPHFIRGVLDGDGCISGNLKGVQFAGSHEFICGLVEQFEKFFGFTAHIVKIKHSPGISSVSVYKIENRIRLLNWIYNNADLKLERKYEKYLQTLEKYKSKLDGLAIS